MDTGAAKDVFAWLQCNAVFDRDLIVADRALMRDVVRHDAEFRELSQTAMENALQFNRN